MSSALNNAVTGLTATSRMAEVVSSNLSNALTEGYGRRGVELSSVQVGGRGGGVRVDSINRFVDAGLLADRRLADAALSGQERSVDLVMRLEQAIGGPDDAAGLGARLAEFERALIAAGSDPASELRLASVVARLEGVAGTLKANTASVQALRQDADVAIARDIDVLNGALQQVDALNKDILRISGSGDDPSALLDARQRAVDQIAGIVPVREMPRDNGSIGLMTTSGTTLLDSRPREFGFQNTLTITADMTLASGALGAIKLDGVALDLATGVGRLDGGTLGAAFVLRDQTLVQAQSALDGITADLVARFQDSTNDPSLMPGDIGLLTDQGNPLDLSDLSGLAGRISVNPAIVPAQGGNLALLRDGLNATTPGPTGDAAQINRWIAALDTPRMDVPGATLASASGRIAAYVSEVGTTRLMAQEQLSFTTARWETLREAELADGIDTDVELQRLLQIEQAYAANAKVIQTVDFMMQRLMEL
ncbi:flagellar hook-associated protein FlgK [Roseobacter sp. CCS2]|nr:flagellar hook-associated protein FlgK [Roseobacter sp. CCS2]